VSDAPDFHLAVDGSMGRLMPLSQAAEDWIVANIPEDAQRWGSAVIIDHRAVDDIIEKLAEAGLSITGGPGET
jgi:hypothetical protein